MLSQHQWFGNLAVLLSEQSKGLWRGNLTLKHWRNFLLLLQQLCQQLCCSTNHMASPDHLCAYWTPCPPGGLSIPVRGTKSWSVSWRHPAASPAVCRGCSFSMQSTHNRRDWERSSRGKVLWNRWWMRLVLGSCVWGGLGGRQWCLNRLLCELKSRGCFGFYELWQLPLCHLIVFGLQAFQMQV